MKYNLRSLLTNNNKKHFSTSCPDIKDCVDFRVNIKGGYVIDIYDGDTITIATRYPGLKNSPMYKFRVRMLGIDCPEIGKKNIKENEIAIQVRDILKEKILSKYVTLKMSEKSGVVDPFNRILAWVFLDKTININTWLLSNNLCKEYDGKKKRELWENDELDRIKSGVDKILASTPTPKK